MTRDEILAFNFQTGDILIIDGEGFISDGIEWVTGGPWSHCALYVGGGEQHIIEAVGDGVEISTVRVLLKRAKKIMVKRIPGLTVEAAERMKEKAYGLVSLNYDYRQFFTLGIYCLLRKIGIRWSALVRAKKSQTICSELIALAAAEIPFNLGDPKKVTPTDIADNILLEPELVSEVK